MPNGKLVRHAAVQKRVPKNNCKRHPKDEDHSADGFGGYAPPCKEFFIPGSKNINPKEHEKCECCNNKKIFAHDKTPHIKIEIHCPDPPKGPGHIILLIIVPLDQTQTKWFYNQLVVRYNTNAVAMLAGRINRELGAECVRVAL